MLVRTKDTCGGKLRIDGTRISYEVIIDALKNNTIFWILENYPTLTIDDIIECLKYYEKKHPVLKFKARKIKIERKIYVISFN